MQPINYIQQVADPFAQALQGVKIGAGLADIEAQRALAARQQQQQQLLAQEQAKFFTNPNPTMRDAARFASLLSPEQSKAFLPYMEGISKEQQQGFLKTSGRLLSMMQVNPEMAAKEMNTLAAASRNSGDEEDAALYEQMAQTAVKPDGKAAVFISLASRAAAIPGAKEMFESYDKASSTARAEALQPFKLRQETADAIIKEAEAKFAPEKFGADLGLTQAQIDASKAARRASDAAAAKSGADARRAQAEADQISSGIIPADKRPEAETKFRKEYSDQTKGYQEVKSAYGRVLSSEDNAVGDLSLIFGYMKMLDPGSVVREGEFATAQNAAGVPERIQNIYNRVVEGTRLSEAQRKAFKGQAGKLYTTAQEQEATVRKGIERIAKGYGLKTENIFYTPTEQAPTAPGVPAPAALGAPPPTAAPAAPANVPGMPPGFRVIR